LDDKMRLYYWQQTVETRKVLKLLGADVQLWLDSKW